MLVDKVLNEGEELFMDEKIELLTLERKVRGGGGRADRYRKVE